MDHASSRRSCILKYPMLMLMTVVLLNGACGADRLTGDPGADNIYMGPILIWNLSQFELRELYTHNNNTFEQGNSTNAPCYCDCNCDPTLPATSDCNRQNQLCEFLQPDTATIVQWSHREYVSVVREKTEGGFLLGLTTQTPPAFTSACSVLIVFDDGFRALVGMDQAEATPGFPGFPEEISCP